MDRLRQDLRIALRSARRAPAVFATSVVVLALGIGMSVAMFTVFRTVLVRKLPVVDQDRIVVMWTYRADPSVDNVTGTKDLSVVRRESRTMRDIAAVAHWPATPSAFLDGDRRIQLNRGMATGNFFDVLGVRPALGRLFRPSDDEPGESAATDTTRVDALVLSYRAWREQFGGDSAVLGRRLVEPLLGRHYAVVGVAPPGFDYPARADYWIPMWSGWESYVSAFAVGRLRPGATVTAARDEYFAIESRLEPALKARGAHVATFAESVLGDVRPVLTMLAAAVALLLVIACLNVGNLLLLRASARSREIAVRRALGASYRNIVQQLLVEAAAIAVGGGLLGLATAVALVRLLVHLAPSNLPRIDDVGLSGAPIVVAIAVSTIAVLIFGLAPSLYAARVNIASPLRFDARSGMETRRRRAIRQTLVVSQVALAMVMLGGAGLLTKSLAKLERQDAGYTSEHLDVLWYSWDARHIDSASKLVAVGDRLTHRIRAVAGVTAATTIVAPPMLGNGIWQTRVQLDGQSDAESQANPSFATDLVGPEYFRTFGVRLLRGRAFNDGDVKGSALVAIVSDAVARRLWPGQAAIGKRIRLPGADTSSFVGGPAWRTVVGVAADTHLRTVRDASPTIYYPSAQSYWQGSIAIRSDVDLGALTPALEVAGHEVEPSLRLWNHDTMDRLLDEPLAQPRLGALLMSSFGVVALMLAAIGLYGVMASLVRDQVREIGIRMALGASPGDIARAVFGRAALLVAVGAAIGLAAALATARLIATLLFQVTPGDPTTLGAAALVLFGTGALAAFLPARRATRTDPASALRSD